MWEGGDDWKKGNPGLTGMTPASIQACDFAFSDIMKLGKFRGIAAFFPIKDFLEASSSAPSNVLAIWSHSPWSLGLTKLQENRV